MSMKNNNINIKVETNFIKERSSAAIPVYMFSYNIEIKNNQDAEVQLISRYWHITDGNNHIEEVRGPGVVGKQLIIQPNETFKYSSFCPLRTPFGVMHGFFQMKNSKGDQFNALISPLQTYHSWAFKLVNDRHYN